MSIIPNFFRKPNLGIVIMSCLIGLVIPSPVLAIESSDFRSLIFDSVYYNENDTEVRCSTGGSTNLVGSDNAEKIWNFLTGKGLTPEQAAGVMGNLQEESGFNPDAREPNGNGYGIAQWSFERRTTLEKTAADQGVDVADLGFQLDFLYNESVSRSSRTEPDAANEWEGLKRQTNSDDATIYWLKNFERAGIPRPARRQQNARDILARFGSSTGGGGSTSDSKVCGSDSSGEVVGGFSLPVARRWYDQNPEWFTGPHYDSNPAVDIPVPEGTPVYSMSDGTIAAITDDAECGKGVIVNAGDGTTFTYCHGQDAGAVPGAKAGDEVKAGQLIMHSGNTGESQGPHLHVAINATGQRRCPQPLMQGIAEGSPPDVKSLPTSGCTS